MFIQTEETPNPNMLKFIPGRPILTPELRTFPETYTRGNPNNAVCPLANQLLKIEGIDSVFLGTDFITVGKADVSDWYVLKPHILGAMLEHFINNFPLFETHEDLSIDPSQKSSAPSRDYSDIERKIIDLIDTRVRPSVAMDGGDIVFDRFEEGIVYLHMKGACSGCPSSSETLKSGIENILKFYVPEVQEVRQHV